ncbi:Sn1-specific diacylglycerol lipase beta-like, partial [Globisporangium splendens]
MGVDIKRVVLNPRAYLTPFAILVLVHHLPLIIAYLAISKPDGFKQCKRLHDLFNWLRVAFILHAVMAGLMVLDMALTLCSKVYRVKKPENWLILTIFLLYIGNLVWTIYGEGEFRTDTSVCSNDSEVIQDRADSVGYYQHVDFVITVVAVSLGACTSYMCGVHTSSDIAEAEMRWQKRCSTMFRAFTCRKADSPEHDEEDIFQSLGKILGRFFVVRYNTTKFEGLQFNDLAFMLGLVSKTQKQERKEERERVERDAERGIEDPSVVHFPPEEEETRLRDLAFFGKLAIGIYGWPIYVWYSPFYWFRVFGCFSKPTDDQVFDHDNVLQGNRASFVGYTGIRRESLVYLNCYNFVFQAPYSIVKDAERKELIISVRGSMSFYDFITDGLAKVEAMHPEELPDDIPNPHATRTHYGMLRTARSLFADLQVGSRKQLFWDFARRHCSVSGGRLTQTAGQRKEWGIVVCGHSMGAGVGAILSVMLRKEFPTTKAFLYAPPMMFDPETAVWTKSFMTTAVYSDDIVPRLSLANVTRLRDDMATHFHEVANERLFKVRYGRTGKKKLLEEVQEQQQHRNSIQLDVVDASNAMTGGTTIMDSEDYVSSQNSSRALVADNGDNSPETQTPTSSRGNENENRNTTMTDDRSKRSSHVLDLDFLRTSEIDADQDVDVPGEIVHIQPVKPARKCGCTVFLGEQQMKYTLRDASYFRKIWVTPRAVQDHMVHHYDRTIHFLVHNCLEFPEKRDDSLASSSASVNARGKQHYADSSDSSWVEASTDDDGGETRAANSNAPYREIAEVV